MAEYILKGLDATLEVHSAGTRPATRVHPKAIVVMKELGFDLSGAFPKDVDRFVHESFDYVITVCDNARETCPVFLGKVGHRLHMGYRDPAEATGTEEEVTAVFRDVRDQITRQFRDFYMKEIFTARQRGS
jgi:arsenate reductase